MRHRILALILVCISTAAGLAPHRASAASTGAGFPLLRELGAVTGYPDGSLQLSATINRAEALKAVVKSDRELVRSVLFFLTHLPLSPLFPDVQQDSWYAPYVEVAAQRKIATGHADGTLRPGQPLAVAEALVMLHRASRITRQLPFLTSRELPNTRNRWYSEAASAAIAKNLIAEPLHLSNPISRGQFFTMLERLRAAERRSEFAYRPLTPGMAQFPHVARTPPPLPPPQTPSPASLFPTGKDFAITISSLGIEDVAVTHPSDPYSAGGVLQPLRSGLGHLFSYPGERGKVLIYGHSAGYPWDSSPFTRTFRRINELAKGDRVHVAYRGRIFTYEVTHHSTIEATDTSTFDPTLQGEELILYTCWPPESTQLRYLVHASLVETIALR